MLDLDESTTHSRSIGLTIYVTESSEIILKISFLVHIFSLSIPVKRTTLDNMLSIKSRA